MRATKKFFFGKMMVSVWARKELGREETSCLSWSWTRVQRLSPGLWPKWWVRTTCWLPLPLLVVGLLASFSLSISPPLCSPSTCLLLKTPPNSFKHPIEDCRTTVLDWETCKNWSSMANFWHEFYFKGDKYTEYLLGALEEVCWVKLAAALSTAWPVVLYFGRPDRESFRKSTSVVFTQPGCNIPLS